MRRYDIYRYSFGEMMGVISLYLFILALIAYFFYKSFFVFLILLISIPFYIKLNKQKRISKQKARLTEEFVEVLNSVNANVKAGYALENAFIEARKDMIAFYGMKSLMANELTYIQKGLSVNKTLESLLMDFAQRSGVEDIMIFARVFETAKRNGGNLKDVLERTAETINVKFTVEKEIKVLISQRTLELRIMEIIPFLIIAYIGVTSKGYFDVLYHNFKGILFMSLCLGIYGLSVYLGTKMVNINV